MLTPGRRQFSFFSHVYQTFSCIDYLFVDAKLMSKTANVIYRPIIISDHSPLSMHIQISSSPCSPTQWPFNTSLLSDIKFHKFIRRAIDNSIVLNQSGTGTISKALLRDSLKAYLHGLIILFSAQQIQKHSFNLESVNKRTST